MAKTYHLYGRRAIEWAERHGGRLEYTGNGGSATPLHPSHCHDLTPQQLAAVHLEVPEPDDPQLTVALAMAERKGAR